MDIIEEGKRVFDIEIEALTKTRDSINDTFVNIIDEIVNCEGKVVITGMGKPGHIATKLAATFSSLGTPSFFLHPAEALHGDLGMLSSDDIIIAISYSGESDEITRLIPGIRLIGAELIGITGIETSTLAKNSDIVQIFPQFKEACYLGLAPTSSTTAALCYGDALAVVASGIYGFKDTDFGKFHPAGALGKKLLTKISDLMYTDEQNAIIETGAMLKEAIVQLSKKALGIVSIIDKDHHLKGVITDGDLRRLLEKEADVYKLSVDEVMNTIPVTIKVDNLAVKALQIMKEKNISCLPVIDDNDNVIGTIRLQSFIQIGII